MKRVRLGVEKTVSRAERAWFLSPRERRAKPESERDFLAGEIPRVFDASSLTHSLIRCHGKKDASLLKTGLTNLDFVLHTVFAGMDAFLYHDWSPERI